jgi:hypothetical protein
MAAPSRIIEKVGGYKVGGDMRRKKGMFTGRTLRGYKPDPDSPSKLDEALKFNQGLKLTEGTDTSNLMDMMDLSGYKKEQKVKDVEILTANLINADGWLSVPMGAAYWHQPQYNAASHFTVNLIRQLLHLNLIEMKPGYQDKSVSRYTRIKATDQLLAYCPVLPDQVIYEPVNLVEVRDWDGNLIPYRETARTHEVKKKLQTVNDVNGAAEILRGPEVYKAYMVAKFKQKLTLYGRLHTSGFHHVQGLSEIKRAELTINGDPVIELDFSALHPNLMYASVGIQYPLDGDPYTVLHSDEEARPYLKQLLLYLLNSKDFIQAEQAGNNYLYEHHTERKQLKKIGITNARPLMEAYDREHSPINHFFCNGKETGLRVMNLDAKIALDIVYDYAKKGIPILAVHDSFIVQQQYQDLLRDTMLHRYQQHTKGFTINIK